MKQAYQDPAGRVLFVSDGISNGLAFGTFYRKPSGGLARVKTIYLPMRDTFPKAQSDLDLYAQRKRYKKAEAAAWKDEGGRQKDESQEDTPEMASAAGVPATRVVDGCDVEGLKEKKEEGRRKAVKFKRHCLCGASIAGTMPADLAAELDAMWDKEHAGPGHGTATPRQASRARARMDDITQRREDAKTGKAR